MPSIVVFDDTFNPDTGANEIPSRRAGMQHFGRTLSEMLGEEKWDGTFRYGARDAVYLTLWHCNRGGFGVYFKIRPTVWVRFDDIDDVGGGNAPLRCNYIDPDDNRSKTLKVFVAEDDEDASNKSMTVAIPQERSKVLEGDLYTVNVAGDIDQIYHDGTDPHDKNAGFYTLATITFRRCN